MKIDKEEGSIEFSIGNLTHVLYLPLQYFISEEGSEDRKVLDYYVNKIEDLSYGRTLGIVLPSVFDEQGNRLFEYQQFSRGVELPNIKYMESCGDILVGYEEKPKEEVDYEQNDKS